MNFLISSQLDKKTWVTMGNSCFLLAEIKKIFSEIRRHNELFLFRNDVWGILYKISIFIVNHTTNMAAVLVCDWPIKKNLL